MDFVAQINRFLEPVRNRIRMIVRRSLLSLVDDSKNIQLIQVSIMDGEVKSQVERLQNYGFTSNPVIGGEVILLSFSGNRDQSVAIAVDSGEFRKKNLESGESAMYTRFGNFILLKKDGSVEVNSTKDVNIKTTGKIYLGGDSTTLLPLSGVVTGECLDPVTGVPFPDKSAIVHARKI